MVANIILILYDFYLQWLSTFTGWILKPIFDFLVNINLISSNYLTIANNFVDNVCNKIIFARDVIINITGLPPEIITAMGLLLSSVFTLFILCLPLRFILNGIALLKTGKSIGKELGS